MSIILLVVAGVFLVLGITVLQEIRDIDIVGNKGFDGCNATSTVGCGEAFDGANATIIGVGTFADFFTIIVLAIVITIVIGMLLSLFGGRTVR